MYYKKLRNTVTNRLKYEEAYWQKNILQNSENNSGKTWRNIKNILKWSQSASPNRLFFKGSLVTKPQEVANSQNEYFIEKDVNIRSNLPQSPIDPLSRLRNLISKHQNNF